jgi:hypothetical protein
MRRMEITEVDEREKRQNKGHQYDLHHIGKVKHDICFGYHCHYYCRC